MNRVLRIALVRHGETVGNSRVRYFGSTDVPLSREGRRQALAARLAIPGDHWDRVVSSTLSRAWQTALVVSPGRAVALEHDFREIHFGRWEGLTRDEIAERDPALFEEWQKKGIDFDYPEGEPRAEFRARVERGLERLMQRGDGESVIVVAHKGVLRTLVRALTGEVLELDEPALGGVLRVVRGADERFVVRRG